MTDRFVEICLKLFFENDEYEKHERTTRGIFNCRDSSKFMACSPLQVHRNFEENSSEIGN